MATIAKLDILIGANTQRLTKGFKKAQGETKGFAASVSKVGGPIGRIGGALSAMGSGGAVAFGVITAAAIGSAVAISRTLSEIDNVAKTASKLGATTEAISSLQHGAELSGIAANTMAMALQRMTRRLSEAAHGTGEAQAAIKELGLDAERLNNMTPGKALEEIADAMQKVQNPADRLRLAFKLFDSEGAAMVNMLDNGKAGLQEFSREAERLGIVIDAKGAQQVERATDAFTKFKASLSGVVTQITIAMAPALEVAALFLTELTVIAVKATKGLRAFVDWMFVVPEVADKAEKSVGAMQDQMARTEAGAKMIAGLQQQIDLFGKSAAAADDYKARLKGATEDQVKQIRRLNEEIERSKAAEVSAKTIEGLRQQIQMFSMAADEAAAHRAAIAGATKDEQNDIRRLTRQLEGLNKKREEATEAERTRQAILDRGRSLRDDVTTPIEKHQKALDDLNQLYRVGAIDLMTWQRHVAKSRNELAAFQAQARETDGHSVALKGSQEAFEFIARARREAEAAKAVRDVAQQDFAQVPQRIPDPPPRTGTTPRTVTPPPRGPVPDLDVNPLFVGRPLPRFPSVPDLDIDPVLAPPPPVSRILQPVPDIDLPPRRIPNIKPQPGIDRPALPSFDQRFGRLLPGTFDLDDPDLLEAQQRQRDRDPGTSDRSEDRREPKTSEALEKFAAAAPRNDEQRNKHLEEIAATGHQTLTAIEQLNRTIQTQQPKVFRV